MKKDIQKKIEKYIKEIKKHRTPRFGKRIECREFLSKIGTPVVSVIIDNFKNETGYPVMDAFVVLFDIKDRSGTVSILIDVLKNNKKDTKNFAAEALGVLKAKRAIPLLIKLLKDENKKTRRIAASALGGIGARSAVPSLIKALKDKNADVRKYAVDALGDIKAPVKKILPALRKTIKDKNSEVRAYTADAFGDIGDVSAVPILIKALKDKYPKTRMLAACALGQMKNKSTVLAVPALIEGLKDEYVFVREYAIEALGKIGPLAKDAVPALLKLLNYKDRYIEETIAWSLSKILGKPMYEFLRNRKK